VQYRFLKLLPDAGNAAGEGPAERTVLECRRLRATADVARALSLRPGDAVVQVRRVLAFGGTPTILEDLWLPGNAFKGLTAAQMADYQGPTYAMFEVDFGVRMVRAEEKVKAVAADPQQAALLQVAASSPLLSVERVAYTYNDVPMELRRGLYRTETHHYRNDLN
jgi:GntR family transcriptional regulator